MISVQKMPFRFWIVQEAPYFIPSDYVVRELSLSAIFMSSPEMLISVSLCSGINTRDTILDKSAACVAHHEEFSDNFLQKFQPLMQFVLRFPSVTSHCLSHMLDICFIC